MTALCYILLHNLHLPLRRVRECPKTLNSKEKQEQFPRESIQYWGTFAEQLLQREIKVTLNLTLISFYISYSKQVERKLIKQECSIFGSTQNPSFQSEVRNKELTKRNRCISNRLKFNNNCLVQVTRVVPILSELLLSVPSDPVLICTYFPVFQDTQKLNIPQTASTAKWLMFEE